MYLRPSCPLGALALVLAASVFAQKAGPVRIELEPGSGAARYRLGEGADFDAEARLPMAIEHAEDWVGLCPQWKRLVAESPDRSVSGSLRAEARGGRAIA